MEQAQAPGKTQVWRTKQIANRKQPSTNIQMVLLLPSEFRVSGESQQPIQAVGFENLDNPIDGTNGKLGHGFTSADELEEVDIGSGDRPRPTYVSAKLDPEYKRELVDLLKEFKDYFAWEYYEMPGLDRSIVEHRLPIKPGYRPFKQALRRFNPNVLDDIKKGQKDY